MFTPTVTPGVYTTTDATDIGEGMYTLEDGVETSPGVYAFTAAGITITVALGQRRWAAALKPRATAATLVKQRWAGVLT